MVTTPSPPRSGCPINFGLEIFGDRWSLLVLRDVLMQGKCRFREFAESEERIATNVLAERLARLERAGLLVRSRDSSDGRQFIYQPTEAGRRLLPVLVEMAYWGATHDPATSAPAAFATGYEQDRDGLLAALASGFDPTAA